MKNPLAYLTDDCSPRKRVLGEINDVEMWGVDRLPLWSVARTRDSLAGVRILTMRTLFQAIRLFPPNSQLPLVVPARDARTENYNGDRPNCAPHYTKRGAERRVMQRKNRGGRNVSLHHRRYRLHRPPPCPPARRAGANRHLHGH